MRKLEDFDLVENWIFKKPQRRQAASHISNSGEVPESSRKANDRKKADSPVKRQNAQYAFFAR